MKRENIFGVYPLNIINKLFFNQKQINLDCFGNQLKNLWRHLEDLNIHLLKPSSFTEAIQNMLVLSYFFWFLGLLRTGSLQKTRRV